MLFIDDDDGIVSGGFRSTEYFELRRINPSSVHFSWSCVQALGSWVETFVKSSNTRVLLLLPCIEQERRIYEVIVKHSGNTVSISANRQTPGRQQSSSYKAI